MRCAVLFTSLLLLSTIPLSTNVTAEGIDSDTGVTITADFNETTEITTLTITNPHTNDSLLLDNFRTTEIILLIQGVGGLYRARTLWEQPKLFGLLGNVGYVYPILREQVR